KCDPRPGESSRRHSRLQRRQPRLMRIVSYGPEYFPALARAAATARTGRSLGHQPFVDYYYASRDWCRLHLALAADGDIVAAIGVEHVPFEYLRQPLSIGFAS